MRNGDFVKVLVTGASGQLGYDVVKCLEKTEHTVLAPTHSELDITDRDNVLRYFRKNKPEAVIHCAAWTAVDLAEDKPEECRKVNVNGTRNIVDGCKELDIPVMYISTDYVFDGSGTEPWKIDSPTNPLGVYGQSKLDGELIVKEHYKHYIVRISWVFGINGNNFIKTMLKLSQKTDTVRVIADQIGSPTYTADLAPLLCEMIFSGKYGVYHVHNFGYCSWYDVAVETFKAAGIKMNVIPITTAEYSTRAKRPLNSRLDQFSVIHNGFYELNSWINAVTDYVMRILENKTE